MLQILLKSLSTIALKIVATLGSQQMLEWLLFKTAKMITDSTKTPVDNEFYAEFKEKYEKTYK